MKVLLVALAVIYAMGNAMANHHEEKDKKVKHDKEHHHVEAGKDHDHSDEHHGKEKKKPAKPKK